MGYLKEANIAASLKRVWAAWTNPADAERWLAPRANIVFEQGGAYEFFWDEDPHRDSTLGCKLLAIDRHKLLRFQWQGKTEFMPMFKSPHGPTEVEVRFSEHDGITWVVVQQAETRSLPEWEAYDTWMASAWGGALDDLRTFCEGD